MTATRVLRPLLRALVVPLIVAGVVAAALVGLVLANAPTIAPWRASLPVSGRSAPPSQLAPTPR